MRIVLPIPGLTEYMDPDSLIFCQELSDWFGVYQRTADPMKAIMYVSEVSSLMLLTQEETETLFDDISTFFTLVTDGQICFRTLKLQALLPQLDVSGSINLTMPCPDSLMVEYT